MSELQLWDDNPTTVDLLGFASIVDTVVAALRLPSLDPVTIGINAPWGGGKSTVLGLLHQVLDQEPGYRVICLDPWEFDDQFDVRGAVIGEVLQDLLTAYPDAGLEDAAKGLLERISWSRVATSMASGQLVAQTEDLVKAFTPQPRQDAKSLAGFRSEFAKLLQGVEPLQRLVVLVDDLDRCLPDAVMATLEAIKLFLSVKKVAFVLAADQEMARESIAVSLDATGRDEQFALRYVEKIVQLPLSLPRISTDEAGAFIALLLSQHRCEQEGDYERLVTHAQQRRAQGRSPVLADMQDLPWVPDADTLALASRFAAGLAAHRTGSPRSIKRFLNAFALRTRIAERHGINIDASVIAKLMLLEDSHGKDFEALVRLQEAQRAELLERWQAWGRDEEKDKPAEVTEDSREWAASDPDLTTAPIGAGRPGCRHTLPVLPRLTASTTPWLRPLPPPHADAGYARPRRHRAPTPARKTLRNCPALSRQACTELDRALSATGSLNTSTGGEPCDGEPCDRHDHGDGAGVAAGRRGGWGSVRGGRPRGLTAGGQVAGRPATRSPACARGSPATASSGVHDPGRGRARRSAALLPGPASAPFSRHPQPGTDACRWPET